MLSMDSLAGDFGCVASGRLAVLGILLPGLFWSVSCCFACPAWCFLGWYGLPAVGVLFALVSSFFLASSPHSLSVVVHVVCLMRWQWSD